MSAVNTNLISTGTVTENKDESSLTRKGSVTFDQLRNEIANEFGDKEVRKFNLLLKTDSATIAIAHSLASAMDMIAPFILQHQGATDIGISISVKLAGESIKYAVKLEDRDERR